MGHSTVRIWFCPLVVALLIGALSAVFAPRLSSAQARALAGDTASPGPAASTSAGMKRPLLAVMERLRPATQALGQRFDGRPGGFPFQTATSDDGHVVAHYYGQYAGFGADFLAQVQRALQENVQPRLGFSLTQRVDIYIYNSRDDFLAGARPQSPQITGAFSVYSPSAIYMPAYYDAADEFAILSHELTHITFHQHVDAGHLTQDFDLFPLWFEEGQAASDEPDNSPGYGAYDAGLVQNIRSGGRFIDVFSQFVWDYPQDPPTDDLCYAESRAFIKYLYSTFGATQYHQFVADALNGDLPYAAELDFGTDLQALEGQWEVSLGRPAPAHDAGTLPVADTPVSYYPGQLPTQANRTRPYAMDGWEDVLTGALVQAGLGLAVVLLGLGTSTYLFRRQRGFEQARRAAPPLPSAPWDTTANEPLAVREALSIVASLPPLKVSADLSWAARIALALTVPLALAVGLAWTLVDPTQVWQHAALAGASAALALALATGVLAYRAHRRGRLAVAYFVTCGTLLVVALVAGLYDGYTAGITQGMAYEHDAAYALAAQTLASAGAPAADRMRVQAEWAAEAYSFADYADATTHYRAAVALGPDTADALTDEAALVTLTTEWNTKLVNAHRFDEAAHVVLAQLASSSCDGPCMIALQAAGGATYLAWAADLIPHKQTTQALAELTALIKALPGSQAATSARLVVSNQSKGLAGAWAAGKAGDANAMDLLLRLVAVQTRDPVQVVMAAETAQPGTGSLAGTDLYKPDVHLYFIAFRSDKDARAFDLAITDQSFTDTSLFKVAAVTDASGNFTVWLPAGYVYLPLWEAPAEKDNDTYFNYSRQDFITVRPYRPVSPIGSLGA